MAKAWAVAIAIANGDPGGGGAPPAAIDASAAAV